ncbi:alkaline phosphatase [Nocardioides gilvus]|uniref:alkaline phosphatase n=1 Tax=Nocardioides gilvus TaxID=1735589 RepID=UPI000D74E6CD|nr:alkaline phosphatase [Nocardioides gilvus]
MSRNVRNIAIGAAALSLPLALLATNSAAVYGPGNGWGKSAPLIERSSAGQVDEHAGARRITRDQTQVIADSVRKNSAKNVILVIGDGMGDSEITIARNYLEGAGGSLKGIDSLPLTGQMTHYSVDRETGKPDYVADSAATGTAWATGTKTYDNAISVDRHGAPQQSVLQWAKKTGRATGNVSTSEIQDATPAVLYSHMSLRACKGPVATSKTCSAEALENGGPGSISEQLLDTRPDVTLGGGSAFYEEVAQAGKFKGKTLAEQARERGFQYYTDKADLASIKKADQKSPVLALFAPNNLPVKFAPLVAAKGGAALPAAECQPEPAFSDVPALGEMTSKAIDLLTKNKDGRKNGFFLQVESASIDKKDHSADVCGQIGETQQMDEAVQEALEFAKRDGNTMVIVTADHAHTSMIVDGGTPGHDAHLNTADGSEMIVTYGTSARPGGMQHTGAQVRVAGYGPGAANIVGLIDQTDLFFTMRDGMKNWSKVHPPQKSKPAKKSERSNNRR